MMENKKNDSACYCKINNKRVSIQINAQQCAFSISILKKKPVIYFMFENY